MRRPAALAVALLVVFTGCGGGEPEAGGDDTTTTTVAGVEVTDPPATTTPAAPEAGPYDRFLDLVEGLGGDVIDRDSAATRAMLVCAPDGGDWFSGVPISEFPTDLALVRAYCPDREADLG